MNEKGPRREPHSALGDPQAWYFTVNPYPHSDFLWAGAVVLPSSSSIFCTGYCHVALPPPRKEPWIKWDLEASGIDNCRLKGCPSQVAPLPPQTEVIDQQDAPGAIRSQRASHSENLWSDVTVPLPSWPPSCLAKTHFLGATESWGISDFQQLQRAFTETNSGHF